MERRSLQLENKVTSTTRHTFSPNCSDADSNFQEEFPVVAAKRKVTVIGAGVFGLWIANFLLQKKYAVSLIDAYGAGNSYGSSGDRSRVIRSTYGKNAFYFDMNVRSLQLWKQFETSCNERLFFDTGVLWMCHHQHTPLVEASIPYAMRHNMPYQKLSQEDLQHVYPFLSLKDLHQAYYDPYGGYIRAHRCCELLAQHFKQQGGYIIESKVTPGSILQGKMNGITLDGEKQHADLFIFACGPWLGSLFPEIAGGNLITPTKQEVYYFDVSHSRYESLHHFPVWVEADDKSYYYGIIDSKQKTFKVGVDKRGELIDPDKKDREITTHTLQAAKDFLAYRFPLLQDAPLLEGKVCVYENTKDGNLILSKHPLADNVLLVGGGSGHGFKHGPAIGEMTANAVAGTEKVWNLFSLDRLQE